MQNKEKSKVWLRVGLVCLGLLLFVPVLSACSLFGGSDTPNDEPSTLRIAVMLEYGDNYQSYRMQYTDLFEYSNQHIDIEFVSAVNTDYYSTYPEQEERPEPVEAMKELLQGSNPPDVVIVQYEELQPLIDDNLLQPLDPLLQESGINVDEEFVPAVIEGIRELGNNQLYALTPTFVPSALMYNRGLFAEAGVEEPTDGMTWEQTFELASRVANGDGADRVYGFGFDRYRGGDLFSAMRAYTASLENLNIYDLEAEVMTVDTPEWLEVWNDLLELYDQNIMFNPASDDGMFMPGPDSGPFAYDLFMSGQLAMTVVNYYELDQLINANNNASNIEGYEFIDWDVVTFPTHPEAPDVGGPMQFEGVFAINAEAQNQEAAWELLQFIHSDDWATYKSRSSYNMISRIDSIEPKQGIDYNVSAFYELKPGKDPYAYNADYRYWEIESMGRMMLMEVLNGERTIEDALAQWQTDGNARLSEMDDDFDFGGGIPRPEPLPIDAFDDVIEFEDVIDEDVADDAVEDVANEAIEE